MLSLSIFFCNAQTNWPQTKANTTVQVGIPAEFGTPTVQALAVNGWEDGLFISRNGLNLYCIYLPVDGLSWSLDGGPCHFAPYQKGPTYGMNFTLTPVATCTTWLHGDILMSSRTSTSTPFSSWSLSNLSGPIYSEGAPQFSMLNSTAVDIGVFTSNKLPPYKADIYLVRNCGINPAEATGTILPAPVTQTTTEDNPHIERLSANNLVLFFDSPDIPGGTGGLDLWFSTSNDDGITWTVPQQVSLNTTQNEHQPHLYKDNFNQWWIYYTATDPNSKYSIYRAKQTTAGNWNNWGTPQLVVGSGNSAGVGEPTLTQNGDLSFVVIYQDPNGISPDKFDSDPWFLPHLQTSTGIQTQTLQEVLIYPNPANQLLIINSLSNVEISDVNGEQKYNGPSSSIDVSLWPNGVYFLRSGYISKKIIVTH